MSCHISLRGTVFAFHCLSPVERQQVTDLLLSSSGELYDAANARKPDVVYVITSFWADCEPTIDSTNVVLRPVTRFWLQEMQRLGRWLQPDSHPFFEPPPRPKDLWLQYPIEYKDADGDVDMQRPNFGSTWPRMQLPCSPSFLFQDKVPLWPYIAAYLAQPIHDVHELTARLQVMTLSGPKRRFNCLEYAVKELLTAEEQTKLFQKVLPEMARLVLSLPQMFTSPPPLLTPQKEGGQGHNCSREDQAETEESGLDASNKTRVVTQSHRFSKLEVLTLVCGCFFGIFPYQGLAESVEPRRSSQSKQTERRDHDVQFPYFTAVRMFSAPSKLKKLVVLKGQKIRCLLQYFLRVIPLAISRREVLSAEVIDFTRVSVHLALGQGRIRAEQSSEELLQMFETLTHTTSHLGKGVTAHCHLYAAKCVSGTLIEEQEKHLQIDFANKFAGGGVLSSGCVQEEIRFLLSPELLVSCLIFAKLEPHEAFVVHGTERFSAYHGYGGSFTYDGNFQDTTCLGAVADGYLRRECVIVGIDATDYSSARVERQYTRGHVWRDLVKAYAGFAYPETSDDRGCWPVASGNWGCGVFKGDRELKFLIQWLAASLCHRDLVYVLFEGDLDLQTKVDPLLKLATSSKARKWDQKSGGVIRWLMEFLFTELNVDHGTTRGLSVLARASLSLERALVACQAPEDHPKITESKPKQSKGAQTNDLSLDTKRKTSATLTRREEQQNEETTKKKVKVMTKEYHQGTMYDFYAPKH